MISEAADESKVGDDGGQGQQETTTAERKRPTDDFVSSMTFAGGSLSSSSQHRGRSSMCDCDECGSYGNRNGRSSRILPVPQAVLDTLERHKRQRLQMQPLKRSQARRLVLRASSSPKQQPLAIWNWTLPLNAEPLVEFGSSHRLVWIKRLPVKSRLQTIGTGIIGSYQEQQSRQLLDSWEEGDVYFVPSNEGKAVALVHVEDDKLEDNKAGEVSSVDKAIHESLVQKNMQSSENNSDNNAETGDSKSASTTNKKLKPGSGHGPAVLIIVKIPKQPSVNFECTEKGKDNNHATAEKCENGILSKPDWIDLVNDVVSRQPQSDATDGSTHDSHRPDSFVAHKVGINDSQQLKMALHDICQY